MGKRKYPSGSQKRKKSDDQKVQIRKLQEQAAKVFKFGSDQSVSESEGPGDVPKDEDEVGNERNISHTEGTCSIEPASKSIHLPSPNDDDEEQIFSSESGSDDEGNECSSPCPQPISLPTTNDECQSHATSDKDPVSFDVLDPSTWPRGMGSEMQKEIARSCVQLDRLLSGTPTKMKEFAKKYYTGKKKNGETYFREWMRISERSESVYCMPCCLFRLGVSTCWSNYGYGDNDRGFADFHNSSRGVSLHEDSGSHLENVVAWKRFCKDVESNTTIVELLSNVTEERKMKLRLILRGIIDAVLFLAQNNLAFRGQTENITDTNCGNFLSLIKLLSKYYDPLRSHVKNLKKNRVNYLSPSTQNEFIVLCGDEVKQEIIKSLDPRKYFSLMIDATPDSSRKDQLSQIIRSVECSKEGCVIHENFIDFIETTEKTGAGLTEVIVAKLKKDGLDLSNCRGQGYDNGSNMSGIYQGVQARILEINPEAHFHPCLLHSLNRVGVNVCEKNLVGKLILGRIQNIFTFFSGSTSRWEILKAHTKTSLLGHSDTRWSSKADAVRSLYHKFSDVLEALTEISESDKFKSDVCATAESHIRNLMTFKFVLGLTNWKEILLQIDLCNKSTQNRDSDLSSAVNSIKSLCKWMEDFQKTGFNECTANAKRVAENTGIDLESGFSNKRRGRGIHPKFNTSEEVARGKSESNLERFKREFFDSLMKKLLEEMQNRFKQLREANQDFCFLFGNGLSLEFSEKEKYVKDLVRKYPNDFEITSFLTEMRQFGYVIQDLATKTPLSPLDVLNILHSNELETTYRNADIALRIFLTLPVSIASNERSFSKLKLIKNYLRSSMGQERLSGLAILSIERELSSNINFDSVINTFVNVKCRRIKEI